MQGFPGRARGFLRGSCFCLVPLTHRKSPICFCGPRAAPNTGCVFLSRLMRWPPGAPLCSVRKHGGASAHLSWEGADAGGRAAVFKPLKHCHAGEALPLVGVTPGDRTRKFQEVLSTLENGSEAAVAEWGAEFTPLRGRCPVGRAVGWRVEVALAGGLDWS